MKTKISAILLVTLLITSLAACGFSSVNSGIPETEIEKRIIEKFDLRPAAIIKYLDLHTPIYAKTTNYGHFGKENCGLKWEDTVKL